MSGTTEIVLGIDGGGSRTRVWIARLDGTVVARGESAGSNVFLAGVDGSRRAIAEAAMAAWRESSLPAEKPRGFLGIFAGVAGAGAVEDQRALAAALAAEFGAAPESVRVDHDLRIALAGALAGRPGAVLVAGTGAACFGSLATGRTWKAGGWGAVLDDGGSGYWLGLQAMRAVVLVADGRSGDAALADAVRAHLGVTSPRDMLNRLQPSHPTAFDRPSIAALAPRVLAAAAAGDRTAHEIVERGAGELARMVAAVWRKLELSATPAGRLAGAGGLLENQPHYRERVAAAVAAQVPGAILESAEMPPIAGAVLLALELAGVTSDDRVVNRVRASCAFTGTAGTA